MWTTRLSPVLLMALGIAGILSYYAHAPTSAPSGDSRAIIEKAIHLSAGYLIQACGDDGKFVYRVHLDPQIKQSPRYNILRHCGVIYALAMYEQDFPNAKTREALDRAANFLNEQAIGPVPGSEDLLAVWSGTSIHGDKKETKEAKLGGAGIALAALLGLEKIRPGTTSPEVLEKIGNFILHMQKEDGSFYSKYIPDQGGRNDDWVSLYYPGEAILGLLLLHEKDPSSKWLNGATKGMMCLAKLRSQATTVEADHWALLATEKLLPMLPLSGQADLQKDIQEHALRICEGILASRPFLPEDSPEYGGFMDDGRTCPTATRLEGLLAALTFLPRQSGPFMDRMENSVRDGMEFLLRSQVKEGTYAGGIPRAVRSLPDAHPGSGGSFNERAGEVRIDYVQHALSAMIRYRQAQKEKKL